VPTKVFGFVLPVQELFSEACGGLSFRTKVRVTKRSRYCSELVAGQLTSTRHAGAKVLDRGELAGVHHQDAVRGNEGEVIASQLVHELGQRQAGRFNGEE